MNYYLKEIETAPRQKLEDLQSARLIAKIEQVYANVAPYRAKMDEAGVKPSDIKSVADLHKLPFTVKQDLRDSYPYGMFAVPMSEVVRIHASSGTTGKQTVVGYTANDIDLWAECAARSLAGIGGSCDDVVQVAYGYGLFTGGLGMHYGAEKLGAVTIPASSGNSLRQLEMFKDFGTTIACMTPSYALSLIELMREKGISEGDLALKAAVCGAEPWTNEMRAQIEKGFGIKAYDIYGLSEILGPSVSCECVCQCGMHICEDHFIPEIIDPDTLQPLPHGEQGELVFTCITKEAFPLMRYRTRDIARLDYEPCKCGRTLVRMMKPQGRTDDMLIIKGVNVFPSQIESALLSFDDKATQYEIHVYKGDVLEVKIEMYDGISRDTIGSLEEYRRKISEEISSAITVRVNVKFDEKGEQKRSEGKAKRVYDWRNSEQPQPQSKQSVTEHREPRTGGDTAIKQVWIDVKNKPGRIHAVMETLAAAKVNARSLFVADAGDVGKIRLIVDNTEKAVEVLQNSFTVGTNNVIGFTVPDEPGGLCNVMRVLGDNGVNIKYSYSLMNRGQGADIVIRVDDCDKAIGILTEENVKLLSQADL
jgi:phenylacetate-CoA ligase